MAIEQQLPGLGTIAIVAVGTLFLLGAFTATPPRRRVRRRRNARRSRPTEAARLLKDAMNTGNEKYFDYAIEAAERAAARGGPKADEHRAMASAIRKIKASRTHKKNPSLGQGKVFLDAVAYEATKKGQKRAIWEHQFGEDGGKRPEVKVSKQGKLYLKGGDYKIEKGMIEG